MSLRHFYRPMRDLDFNLHRYFDDLFFRPSFFRDLRSRPFEQPARHLQRPQVQESVPPSKQESDKGNTLGTSNSSNASNVSTTPAANQTNSLRRTSSNQYAPHHRFWDPFDGLSLWDRELPFPRWPSLEVMNRLQEPLQMTPMVDVKETDTSYTFTLDIPGVRKEHVKLTLDDHTLTVSAERTEEFEEDVRPVNAEEAQSNTTSAPTESAPSSQESAVQAQSADANADKTNSESKEVSPASNKSTRKFRSYGRFYQSFDLPDDIDTKGISAKHEHGQLKIVVPKLPQHESSATTIEIQ